MTVEDQAASTESTMLVGQYSNTEAHQKQGSKQKPAPYQVDSNQTTWKQLPALETLQSNVALQQHTLSEKP